MWLRTSIVFVASVCVVLGTLIFLFHRNSARQVDSVGMTDKTVETDETDQNSLTPFQFQLSLEPITAQVVVESRFQGEKGYLLPQCQLPLHHGVQKCTNTSSLRFYMDPDTETCLAFKYSGCGGNANNFDTWSECARCFAADYSGCPAGTTRLRNADNSTTCQTHSDRRQKCTDPNAYCDRGAFFGQCCDKKVRDLVNADQNSSEGCGPGLKKVETPTGSFHVTLLGKTCGSSFCPRGATCHQGNYFAYCCR